MFPPPVMLLSSVKDVRMPRLRTAMTTPRTGTVRRWFSGRACGPHAGRVQRLQARKAAAGHARPSAPLGGQAEPASTNSMSTGQPRKYRLVRA